MDRPNKSELNAKVSDTKKKRSINLMPLPDEMCDLYNSFF
jgi:hypothetical protein